jgi:hypothetical protein
MSRNSNTQRATGTLAIRVVIWLMALTATAGAVLSIDRVLRNKPADEDTTPSVARVLPSSSGGGNDRRSGDDRGTRAIDDAARNVAALTGRDGTTRDSRRDDTRRTEIPRTETARADGVPSFDVARVEPTGDTVVAGRASPGATIELLRNGTVHDRVVADASGQFVMVPPKLPVGESELTLRSRPPGGVPATSRQTVVVAVQPNLRDQPVVALMTPDKPSVVLSKPSEAGVSSGSIVVESVEAEAGGKKLFVTGRAAPGALVRLYLNDSYHSTTTADGSGRAAFTAKVMTEGPISGGDFRVRLDDVDRPSGVVKSRAEVPFSVPQQVAAAVPGSRAAIVAAAIPGEAAAASEGNAGPDTAAAPRPQKGQTMTVARGDSLWRISRLAYGDGTRYIVIYDANHRQIRNPNRIYPGQVFIIPEHKGQ